VIAGDRLQAAWRLGADPIEPGGGGSAIPEHAIEYDQVLEQIHRHETAGDGDWAEVDRLASLILRRDGKDLRIALHRLEARGRLDGWTGWSEGLATIAAILREHWPDRVFPSPNDSGRAVAGLLSRLADRIETWPSPSDADAHDAATALGALVDALRDRWGPSMGTSAEGEVPPDRLSEAAERLVGALERRRDALPAASRGGGVASAEDPTPAVAAEARPSASRVGPDVEEADGDDPAAVEGWLDRLAAGQKSAALAMLAHRPLDPRPYVLLRAAAWAKAEALGIDSATGEVQLRPVEEGADPLAALPEKPTSADLLAAEKRVAANPFWLDLTVRSLRLLERFGADGDKARRAVAAELQALLSRRPDLRGAVLRGCGRPLLSVAIGGSESEDSATKTVSTEPRPEAAGGLASVAHARGGRERFEASLAAVRDGNLAMHVTRDLLESLLEVTESSDLESWEPALASTLFEQVLAAKGSDERWERMRDRAALGLARTAPDRLAQFQVRRSSSRR